MGDVIAILETTESPLDTEGVGRRAQLIPTLNRLYCTWLAKRGTPDIRLSLTADATEAILLARWPFDVRSLDRLARNLSQHHPHPEPVSLSKLPVWLTRPPPPTRQELIATLARNHGSIRATAKHFQRDRRQIYRWMASRGIDSSCRYK